MANLPFPWSLYQENQTKAAQCGRITDRSWGIENGLAKLLTDIEAAGVPSDGEEARARFGRAIASGSRNERHRARLRRQYLPSCPVPHAERSMIARILLGEIRNAISRSEWKILLGIAAGFNHSELSDGHSAGTMRTRVSRLRNRVRGMSAVSAVFFENRVASDRALMRSSQ